MERIARRLSSLGSEIESELARAAEAVRAGPPP